MAEGSFTGISANSSRIAALTSIQRWVGVCRTRLATGKRINEAADDPAGLTMATKLSYRASGLGVALDSIGDGKRLLSVAEDGLVKIQELLAKMRNRTVQAASDAVTFDERQAIQDQLTGWTEEIDAVVGSTRWSGKKLLDGLTGFDSSTVRLHQWADTSSAGQLALVGGLGDFGSVAAVALGVGFDPYRPPAPSSAALFSDDDGIVVGGAVATPGPGNRSDIPQLTTGRYTVLVHRRHQQDDYTIQLLNSDDVAVSIDPDGDPVGTPADAPATKISGAGFGQRTVNFGTDLSLTVTVPDANGNYRAVVDYTAADPGVPSSLSFNGDLSTAAGALTATTRLDAALDTVAKRLQTLGSVGARMAIREETTIVAHANVEAARSRIMDADLALEQLRLVKGQISEKVYISMLAQANARPQTILSLLGVTSRR